MRPDLDDLTDTDIKLADDVLLDLGGFGLLLSLSGFLLRLLLLLLLLQGMKRKVIVYLGDTLDGVLLLNIEGEDVVVVLVVHHSRQVLNVIIPSEDVDADARVLDGGLGEMRSRVVVSIRDKDKGRSIRRNRQEKQC